MEERVSISISEGVADVRLVRADKMNALDQAMFEALVAATDRLSKEKGVRVVVLSGEGRAFCAGLDMGRFAAMKEKGGNGIPGGENRDLTERTHGQANFPQQAVWGWRQLPVPVIAAIQGVAFGGGFQLALGADMRFLAPDARMSVMEIKWGLVPDMAGTPILASLVRDDILRDLTYTGRIFSAQEAMSYGLATRICDDPRAAALEVAREIAGKSPDAIRAAKRMLNNLSVDPGPALLAESVEQQKLIGSANQTEAVRANLEKRAPRFADVALDLIPRSREACPRIPRSRDSRFRDRRFAPPHHDGTTSHNKWKTTMSETSPLPRHHLAASAAAATPKSPIAPTASPAACSKLGVRQGDSVCMLMRNDIAFIEAAYAAMRLGAYGVPINWHFKPEEINYMLKDSGTRVLIGHADMLHALRDAIPDRRHRARVPTPPEILANYKIDPDHLGDAGLRDRFRDLAEAASAL